MQTNRELEKTWERYQARLKNGEVSDEEFDEVSKILDEGEQRLARIRSRIANRRLQASWEFQTLIILAHLLPKRKREEYIGDFCEDLIDLSSRPRWHRVVIALGRCCLFLIAAARVEFDDIISPDNKKRL